MLHICYLRRGIVYVPTLAKVEAGGYMAIDPISVVPISKTADLLNAFRDAMRRGNPVVPTPTRENHPKPAVLKYAGVNTWTAFARRARGWHIEERGGTYRIIGQRNSRTGGWENDSDQTVNMPAGSSTDEVIDRMIAILQAAAQ